MKQHETGNRRDLIEHRFRIAKEDLEEIAFKRHKDTLAYFNKQYVATEIFPREMGRKIVKAEEIRHASDYDTFYVASKEITIQQIETAKQLFCLAVEYYERKCEEQLPLKRR